MTAIGTKQFELSAAQHESAFPVTRDGLTHHKTVSFTHLLPGDAATVQTMHDQNSSVAVRMNDNSHKTVLVVEDMDEISQNMNAMLIEKGYRVLNAIDAEGAIELAEQSRPAMILTDLDLPTLTELMDKLRAHEDLKHLPVAVIDLNHPKDGRADINILNDFDELDDLMTSRAHG